MSAVQNSDDDDDEDDDEEMSDEDGSFASVDDLEGMLCESLRCAIILSNIQMTTKARLTY